GPGPSRRRPPRRSWASRPPEQFDRPGPARGLRDPATVAKLLLDRRLRLAEPLREHAAGVREKQRLAGVAAQHVARDDPDALALEEGVHEGHVTLADLDRGGATDHRRPPENLGLEHVPAGARIHHTVDEP